MDDALFTNILVESMRVTILLALPILLSGLIVGLVISILQATTSIQEQTLTFVPKIIAIIIALVIFGPWMALTISEFSLQLFELIPEMAIPTP
jgi:flagellar biosynthetic protein FliQ